jgi:ElaB/YqjD/DUF883 family membrane-anchored ribosome-binding protein
MNVLTEKVSQLGETMAEVKEAAEGLAHSAAQQLDQARRDTAGALHTAASSVRTTGCHGADAVDKVAGGAADKLDATAAFVEDHDLRISLTSLRRFGRRHPATTLFAGLAFGMLAGSLVTRIALGPKN